MTADNDMVERVANAIAQANMDPRSDAWDERDAYMDMARAAIEAMREPTTAMFNAARPHMDSPSSNIAWWEAMIDAALKREGE